MAVKRPSSSHEVPLDTEKVSQVASSIGEATKAVGECASAFTAYEESSLRPLPPPNAPVNEIFAHMEAQTTTLVDAAVRLK